MISKEEKARYDRERYLKLRASRFGDRRCKTCEIRMAGKFGARNTRTYCGDCRANGAAARDMLEVKREYYRQNKERILEQRRVYAEEHRGKIAAYQREYGKTRQRN